MATVEHKKLVMAGPMRWIVLTWGERVTTVAWFVHVLYTAYGAGTALFSRSDVHGTGKDDLFAVFSDSPTMARYLRDEIFSYTAFAGTPGETAPAPVIGAVFHCELEWPERISESMHADDGTSFRLTFRHMSEPTAYVRQVREGLMEVGAFSVPTEFLLEINGAVPVGALEKGPLAEAPPAGADLQNLWYELS